MKVAATALIQILLSMSLFANEPHATTTHTRYSPRDFEKTDKDVQTPVELIKVIEEDYLRLLKVEKKMTDEELLNAKSSIPRSFLNLDIYLEQKTSGVLKSNSLYSMENTGGVIDLGQALTGRNGSFYVRTEVKPTKGEDLKNLKVYFLSNNKSREIGGDAWGSGCGKLFDVTSYFREQMSKKGLLTVSTEQRHLAVLGGTFYFILTTTEGLHLATLSFVDRRFPKEHCRSI